MIPNLTDVSPPASSAAKSANELPNIFQLVWISALICLRDPYGAKGLVTATLCKRIRKVKFTRISYSSRQIAPFNKLIKTL